MLWNNKGVTVLEIAEAQPVTIAHLTHVSGFQNN